VGVRLMPRTTLLIALTACQSSEPAAPVQPAPVEPAPPPRSAEIGLYSLADTVPYPSVSEGAAAHVPEPEGAHDGGSPFPGMSAKQAAKLEKLDQSWRDRDSLWARRGQAAAGLPAGGQPLCRPTLELREGKQILRCPEAVSWTAAPGLEHLFGLAVVALDGKIAGFCQGFSPTECVVGGPFVEGDAGWTSSFGVDPR